MAFDSLTLNTGVGGSSLAFDTFTDDDAVSRVMAYGAVAFGALNGPYTPVTSTTGFPVRLSDGSGYIATLPVSIAATVAVSGPLTDAQLRAAAVPVSAASLPLPSGAATAANQAAANTALAAVQAAVELLDNAVAGNELQVDVVSSALPAGAATAAKQPALGTAGAASADVLTVQGVAGMTAVKVDGSAVTQPVSGTVTAVGAAAHDAAAGGAPVLLGAYASASAPAAVSADGDAVQLWADRAGRLQVGDGGGTLSVDDGAGTLTVDNGGTFAVQESGAALTALQLIDNLVLAEDAAHASGDPGVQVLAVRQDTPASSTSADGDYSSLKTDSAGRLWCNVGNTVAVSGTFWQATQPVSVAATVTVTGAGGTFPVTDSGSSLTVDAPVGTPVFVRLSDGSAAISTLPVSLASVPTHDVTNAGTFAVQAAQSGTWTVQPGNTANTTAWLVTDPPVTSGGLSMHKTVSAASTNATSVKASAGQVYSVQVFNTNAAARYLKLYNLAAAPTVGTDTPVKTLTVPGNTAGAGLVLSWDKGLAFGTGIAFALTTGAADSDTGAVAAGEIVVNLDYK